MNNPLIAPASTLNALELWREMNNPQTPRFEEVNIEYNNRFNNHVVKPTELEYRMELIYELGFWAGNELYVPVACHSVYHNPKLPNAGLSLPYAFIDGTKRMVCANCNQSEWNVYNQK